MAAGQLIQPPVVLPRCKMKHFRHLFCAQTLQQMCAEKHIILHGATAWKVSWSMPLLPPITCEINSLMPNFSLTFYCDQPKIHLLFNQSTDMPHLPRDRIMMAQEKGLKSWDKSMFIYKSIHIIPQYCRWYSSVHCYIWRHRITTKTLFDDH